MPTFYNDKGQAVRVKNEDGELQRIREGEVVHAAGRFADALSEMGLPSATSDQIAAEQEYRYREAGVPAGDGSRLAAKSAISPARARLRRLVTVGPLHRVVGDDQAPLGPPSGVVTTKQAVARTGVREREAFADHEALPGDEIDGAGTPDATLGTVPTGDAIHNAQVIAAEDAEDAAEAFIGGDAAVAPAVSGDPAVTGESDEPPQYDRWNKTQLENEANSRGLSVTGTGQDGYVTKDDFVAALSADDSAGS